MQLNWMERGLIHPVLLLRPLLSWGMGQGMTPVDGADVGISDLQGQSTGLTRELFKGQSLGHYPISINQDPQLS